MRNHTILVVLSLLVASSMAARDRISGLPHQERSAASKTYGGFVNVNEKYGANLYYYFVESQNSPRDPLILWLQGGPGCSSLFGTFVENGPSIVQDDGTFKSNPWAWTTNASVIWVDSPVGTGYSYVDNSDGYATNEETIAQELLTLLRTFLFKLHPEYSSVPLYIFGESYAGKYVPYLTYTVLQYNTNSTQKINLSGIGVGDGWVSPYYQTGSFAPFLYNNGLINELEVVTADGLYETYKGLLDIGLYDLADSIGNSLLGLLTVEAGGIEVYDIRKTVDPTDALLDVLSDYLNKPDIRKKMNAGNSQWSGCADAPYFYLAGDIEKSSEKLFPKILAANVPVLLYNGNKDLICNMLGTTTWVANMQWPYSEQWKTAKNTTWYVDGAEAGYYRAYNYLTHLIVENAGHMSPYDQPKNCHDLVNRFMKGGFKP
jgi:carboxypeptidase C (cathepsin A)